MELGNKILQRRKELGITQAELAEKMYVTRQTISRWEAGYACPDVQKVVELATILDVSCDYLLRDSMEVSNMAEQLEIDKMEESKPTGVTRLLRNLKGKRIKITFYEDEEEYDMIDAQCRVIDFHGNWMEVEFNTKKESKTKIISVASILGVEIVSEN